MTASPSPRTISIDGVDYIRQDLVPAAKPSGNRAIVVIDRGWIYAGDIERVDGRIKITRAVWVFKWSSCGFAAVVADPTKADLRPVASLDVPMHSEIYSIPVGDNWGLKDS